MPTYVYLCETINEEFEEFHSINSKLEDCPLCKEAGRESHEPKRLISGGSGRGIVELSYNELKEAMPGAVAKIQRRAARDENFLANLVGESKYHRNQS